MNKKRLIGKIILYEKISVQSIQYKKYLPLGSPKITAEYLDRWGVDEIIILDIDATSKGKRPNFKLIREISKIIRTPLTVGGGIKSINEVYSLIRSGADKVSINSSFLKNPEIIKKASKYFGNQSIIVSIDLYREGNKKYKIYNKNLNEINVSLFDAIKIAEDCGAGELMIGSVLNDGMKSGYDIELFTEIRDKVNIPIIMSGGIGKIEHIIHAADLDIEALAIGNMLNFTEMSVVFIKEILKRKNLNFRYDTFANFNLNPFDHSSQRITNHSERVLEKMKFTKITEEKL